MRKLLIWSGIVFVFAMLPMSGIYVLGKPEQGLASKILGPTSREVRGCWYGICPAQTSLAQSVDRMTSLASELGATLTLNVELEVGGYLVPYAACLESSSPKWRTCVRGYYDIKDTIELDLVVGESGLRAGDIVAWLGSPSSIFMCAGTVFNDPSEKEGVLVDLQYADGSVFGAYRIQKSVPAVYPVPTDEWTISPEMVVKVANYYPYIPDDGKPDNEMTFPWRGFTRGPERRYSCGN